jgi:hypothetical protein
LGVQIQEKGCKEFVEGGYQNFGVSNSRQLRLAGEAANEDSGLSRQLFDDAALVGVDGLADQLVANRETDRGEVVQKHRQSLDDRFGDITTVGPDNLPYYLLQQRSLTEREGSV